MLINCEELLVNLSQSTEFQPILGITCLTFGKRGKKDIKAHVKIAAISGESSPGAHRESMTQNAQK